MRIKFKEMFKNTCHNTKFVLRNLKLYGDIYDYCRLGYYARWSGN